MLKKLDNGLSVQVESHEQMEDATPTTTIKSPVTLTSDQGPVSGLYYKNQKLTVPANATYLNVKSTKDLYFALAEADLDPAGTLKRQRIVASDFDRQIPVAGKSEIWLRFVDAANTTTATIYFSFTIV